MLERGDLWEFSLWLLRGLGAIIASAVYLTGAIAYGIAIQSPMISKLALAAAGVSFLGYLMQVIAASSKSAVPSMMAQVATWFSVILGALAGLVMLIA